MADLYRLENIRRRYNNHVALSVDELTVEEGSIVGLSGPNGCGKSTLMRILAFLDKPDYGVVNYDGRMVNGDCSKLRGDVTLLNQDPYLMRGTVLRNVAFGLRARGDGKLREKAREALLMVGLDPDVFGPRARHELSGGEARRVALAARLALKPRVLLLDEPTAGLDIGSVERIRLAVKMVRKQWGATLVIISHDMDWLQDCSDRVYAMEAGRLSSEVID